MEPINHQSPSSDNWRRFMGKALIRYLAPLTLLPTMCSGSKAAGEGFQLVHEARSQNGYFIWDTQGLIKDKPDAMRVVIGTCSRKSCHVVSGYAEPTPDLPNITARLNDLSKNCSVTLIMPGTGAYDSMNWDLTLSTLDERRGQCHGITSRIAGRCVSTGSLKLSPRSPLLHSLMQ